MVSNKIATKMSNKKEKEWRNSKSRNFIEN
jgi:hypothetical protein